MLLTFDRLRDRPGLEIVDHVERRQCTVETDCEIELTDASVDDFHFPADGGVSFEAQSLTLPHTMPAFVRNSMGFIVEEVTKGEYRKLPADHYTIELAAPVKLELVVDSTLDIEVTADEVFIDFDDVRTVNIGARSYHEHPAATVTATEDPEDVMAAVSVLGSALKTTSVERSYPTLRGHPPTIELGDELEIPEELEAPDTGVTIEVPPDIASVFVVAPLAYYFGASVEPGPVPKLRTETGFEHVLDGTHRGFEGEVERVLKQAFFLDCLTRTEGYYQVNLHERNAVEPALDLDFEALYEASLAEQLEAYLSVPFEAVEREIPEWKLTTHVAPIPEHVEILPFVINDLAVVRTPEGDSIGQQQAVEEPVPAGEFTRSSAEATRSSVQSASVPELIRPEEADSLEQAWVGDGAPIGASKAMIEAFRNRLDRTPTDGDIDITVICNDTAMNSERDIVDDIYGSREELPFDIEAHHELTVEELRSVLEADCDFLHYIGHIDERGFECADGMLDAETLESTGVDAFFLNACTSYQQGMELIRAGAVAGVVTVEDVINSGAETIGKTMAKLLNHGFPFRVALNIARDQSIVGSHYLVLGDGGIDIAQTKTGIPVLCEIDDREESFHLTYNTYPVYDAGLGSIVIPYAGENNEYYLTSGETGHFNLNNEELSEFLAADIVPVQWNGNLHWSDEFMPLLTAD